MIKSYQKMISLTTDDELTLKTLSEQSGLTQSNVIRQMLRIVNSSEDGALILKMAAKLKEEELDQLRIMADMENLKKVLGTKTEVRPRTSRDDYWNGNTIEQTIAIAKTRWIDDNDN